MFLNLCSRYYDVYAGLIFLSETDPNRNWPDAQRPNDVERDMMNAMSRKTVRRQTRQSMGAADNQVRDSTCMQ